MSFHTLAFVAVPYAAVVLAVVGTAYRFRYRKFTVSSLSSQLLERSKLYWGSIPFHWGILIILGGHLLALIIPASFTAWNSVPVPFIPLPTNQCSELSAIPHPTAGVACSCVAPRGERRRAPERRPEHCARSITYSG